MQGRPFSFSFKSFRSASDRAVFRRLVTIIFKASSSQLSHCSDHPQLLKVFIYIYAPPWRGVFVVSVPPWRDAPP